MGCNLQRKNGKRISMKYKYTNPGSGGKRSIKKYEPFVDAVNNRSVLTLGSFETVLKQAELLIKKEYPASANAVRKVRVDWYEGLISLGATEYAAIKSPPCVLVSLPNVTSFKVHKLYKPEISVLVDELADAVEACADVRLISSNPDFAIIRKSVFPAPFSPKPDLAGVKATEKYYENFAGKCELDDIRGFLSIKTSLKPDRRLQIAHEGSLMKALYRHIQTRKWLIGAPGISYFGMTMKFGDADVAALKTVATHSIVDVLGTPESAVDRLCAAPDGASLSAVLSEILHV